MSQISIDRLHATAKKHKKNGDIDAARVIYTQILENYPQNRRARTALDALQEVPSTSAHLALSGEAAPNILRKDAGISSVTVQDAERQKLTQLLHKGQIKDALNYATDLLKSYPDNPMLIEMISKILLMQNDHREALPYLKKLIQMNPKYEGHVRTASQIQVRKKTYQNSSRDCEAYASSLKPLLDGLGSQAPRLGS
jgi:tetratricopeptide (TPR) repeat protein